uniref:C40 family peptidase n=1 Tax=Prevotella sp. GTC17260 TaxID=3236796 RepID=A0AB33JDM2_9BACT
MYTRRDFLKKAALATVGSTLILEKAHALEGIVRPLMRQKKGSSKLSETPVTHPTESWGIVTVSVCNMRQADDYNSGQVSQALLGMPVRILAESHEWTKIQTPENYMGWTLTRTVARINDKQHAEWNGSEQVVVTSIYGMIYSEPKSSSQTVSDVVAGNRFKLLNTTKHFYHVAYPDGRKGYLKKADGDLLSHWRKHLKQDAQSIIATGKSLMGLPYMWGGTSTKGVDCSGFIRTTLFMHDIIIPRDASQQAYKGKHIDIAPDFGNLIPGDLVFFGTKNMETKKSRVSHVGIYIGNKKFIHSLGFVHIASFNPSDEEYDEYDLNRLLWAQRILPYINKEEEMTTTAHNTYYQ